MNRRSPRPMAGFTLVELMIALSLFAMISVATLALMRSSIDTQAALDGRLDRVATVERIHALLSASLLAAQPQALRSTQGQAPAFIGTPTRLTMLSAVPDADGAVALQRLTLTIGDGALRMERADDAPASPPTTLLANLSRAGFRYRDANGQWHGLWTPPRPDALPRAVELTLQQRDGAEILMRFAVAPDWPELQPS